ncbi:MAG: hypothetical protein ACKO2L_19790 [Planctomycetaceae bacterium]
MARTPVPAHAETSNANTAKRLNIPAVLPLKQGGFDELGRRADLQTTVVASIAPGNNSQFRVAESRLNVSVIPTGARRAILPLRGNPF